MQAQIRAIGFKQKILFHQQSNSTSFWINFRIDIIAFELLRQLLGNIALKFSFHPQSCSQYQQCAYVICYFAPSYRFDFYCN